MHSNKENFLHFSNIFNKNDVLEVKLVSRGNDFFY